MVALKKVKVMVRFWWSLEFVVELMEMKEEEDDGR